MSWEETMRAAEAAKNRMLLNRRAGERLFSRLLEENVGDGMVYFQRGLVFESLNETALAIRDFQRAHSLLLKQNGNGCQRKLWRECRRNRRRQ